MGFEKIMLNVCNIYALIILKCIIDVPRKISRRSPDGASSFHFLKLGKKGYIDIPIMLLLLSVFMIQIALFLDLMSKRESCYYMEPELTDLENCVGIFIL